VPVQSGSARLPTALEYVVVLPNRWAIGQDVRVCFYGGDAALRKRILDVVKPWFDAANLRLVPGSSVVPANSKTRARFESAFASGILSYIGTDSVRSELVTQDLPSMNFQGFDVAPPAEPRFTGLVLT